MGSTVLTEQSSQSSMTTFIRLGIPLLFLYWILPHLYYDDSDSFKTLSSCNSKYDENLTPYRKNFLIISRKDREGTFSQNVWLRIFPLYPLFITLLWSTFLWSICKSHVLMKMTMWAKQNHSCYILWMSLSLEEFSIVLHYFILLCCFLTDMSFWQGNSLPLSRI